MPIIKKKVILTPEVKIEIANQEVFAQQVQFRDMLEKSKEARQTRLEAIEELAKEASSLEAILREKLRLISLAEDQNEADQAFERRIAEFIG